MRKLLTTILFSVSAILLSHAPNVYAIEKNIYKCTTKDAKIIFQDYACVDVKKTQISRFKVNNQYKVLDMGLRPLEVKMLEKMHQRLMIEQILNRRQL